MIRVRRSADDFLANLVQNIQVQDNGRRQRRVRRDIVVEKKQVPPAPKGHGRPPIKPTKRPAAQREVVKARQPAHKPPDKKHGTNPTGPKQNSAKQLRKPILQQQKQQQQQLEQQPQLQCLPENIDPHTPVEHHSLPAPIQVEQIQQCANPPVDISSPFNLPQVESIGHTVNKNHHHYNSFSINDGMANNQQQSYPLAHNPSSNNFYLKNRSDIFLQGPVIYAQHDVLDKALRIASQQPLPASPRTGSVPVQRVQDYNVLEPISEQNTQQNLQLNRSQPAIQSNHHALQQFSIGGNYTDKTTNLKELERQKWIKELEAQIEEKKQRKEAEKEEYVSVVRSPARAPNLQHPNPVLRSSLDQHMYQSVQRQHQQQRKQQHQQQHQQLSPQQYQPTLDQQAVVLNPEQYNSNVSNQRVQHPVLSPPFPKPMYPQQQQPQQAFQQPQQAFQQLQQPFQQPQQPFQQPQQAFQQPQDNNQQPQQQFSQQQAQQTRPPQLLPQHPNPVLRSSLDHANSYQQQISDNSLESPIKPDGHLLGQHSMVDPMELERRSAVRLRALEHQEALRAQVLEKERKKKEKEWREAEEEATERRRYEDEKRKMEEDKRAEIERNIKKEQEKQHQVNEIARKMEESNQAALLSKQRKRPQAAAHGGQQSTTTQQIERALPEKECQSQQSQLAQSQQFQSQLAQSQQFQSQLGQSQQIQQILSSPPQQGGSTLVTQPTLIRYISEAGTQTVTEQSCQTSPSPTPLLSESKLISISRENSHLMSDTTLLRLQTRDLSAIQRNDKKQTIVSKTKISKEGRSKEKSGVKYDENGRRIRNTDTKKETKSEIKKETKSETKKVTKQNETTPKHKLFTTRESSLVIEEYQPVSDLFQQTRITEVDSVQEELKWWTNTPSDLLSEVVANVASSPPHLTPQHSTAFTLGADQIQLHYSSPHNDNGYIPSAISSRQNDILGQLAQLRLGLKNRRRVMSNSASEMKV